MATPQRSPPKTPLVARTKHPPTCILPVRVLTRYGTLVVRLWEDGVEAGQVTIV